jgi:hypothetical protein
MVIYVHQWFEIKEIRSMTFDEIMEKLKKIEYHQRLLVRMVSGTERKFDVLIVEKSLSESEVADILTYCESLSNKIKKQKAEGFVYFHPLYNEFKYFLEPKLKPEEVIIACLEQGIFVPLMLELKKYTTL